MKDRLSALMDGELDDRSAAEAIQALGSDREAVRAWRTYQLISDAMRQSRVLSADFTARVAERLKAEPTVLAPRARVPGFQSDSRKWFALSAAASVAAVGVPCLRMARLLRMSPREPCGGKRTASTNARASAALATPDS